MKSNKKTKQTEYENCKSNIINSYMKKYEKGTLKSSNNKLVKNRLQALAIALSVSEKICESKIRIVDIKKMENKVNKMLYNKEKKLSSDKLQFTNIKNAIFLLNYYKKKKKTKQFNDLQKKLFARCLLSCGEKSLTPSINKEIKKYIINNF